jgi:hypothetical protein
MVYTMDGTITATLDDSRPGNFNRAYHKDKGLTHGYKVIDCNPEHADYNDEPSTVADIRVYFPGSVCYCAAWLHGTADTSGTGKAGGYGYHMQSAAIEAALKAAGFNFNQEIGGRGTEAEQAAIMAAARAIALPGAALALIEFYA